MKKSWKGMGMIALAALLWSAQGVLGKAGTWGSLSLVGVRAIFASFVLGCVRKDFRLPKRPAEWIAGTFVALTALLFLCTNKLTSASNAIILQYTMPVFVMLLGVIFLRKKPTAAEIAVSACVLSGVFLCASGSTGQGNLLGDGLALLSAITYAGVFSAGKLLHVDAKDYSYTGNLLCLLFLLAIPFDPSFDFKPLNVLSAASMGLTVGLGYAAFAKGLSEGVQPVTAAIISNIEPVGNPVWVFLFLGEAPPALSLIGFAIVLTAVTVHGACLNTAKEEKT